MYIYKYFFFNGRHNINRTITVFNPFDRGGRGIAYKYVSNWFVGIYKN